MTTRVSVVVGNPKPRSRTLQIATAIAERLLDPAPFSLDVIDLAAVEDDVFAWPHERLSALSASVAASDLVVIASPTYKGTYTGLLKAFLDRYPAGGLQGVVAIPLLTGADRAHAMGATHTLAPLLVELGAIVPGRGVFFPVDRLDRLPAIAQECADEFRANLARLGRLAAHVGADRALAS
jgi:FMN reductase